MCSVTNDALCGEVDETQSHMNPVVVLEKLDLVRYVSPCGNVLRHFVTVYGKIKQV